MPMRPAKYYVGGKNYVVGKKPMDSIDPLCVMCYGHVGCILVENLEIFLQAST